MSPKINIIIYFRNGSHQIPHGDISKIRIYIFKLDILSNSLPLVLGSINTTSLSKLEYAPIIGVYYMPGTGLIIGNMEMNGIWVDFSHVIGNLTLGKRGKF